ncbi:MAG: NADH-quinone oxidoreductase subunit NuoH [Candidatus Carbobacillus sp.]|nr:NADH-quinone oxidoreductase subunit NuoH [Candidatus Carbobacillus sp.]
MREWLMGPMTLTHVIGMALVAFILLNILLGLVTYAIYIQRKLLGWMQNRIGPKHVGPFGLLQTIADVLKLLVKESFIPNNVDKSLFLIAPVVAFAPAFIVFAVLPLSENIVFTHLDVGLLFYIGVAGLSSIGVIMGGWSSNNKWSLIGAMRAAAMMISYEIPLVLAALGVVMLAGSMNLYDIVTSQATSWHIIPQILGFVVFYIAALAELNRTPFDLTEAESELIAGYFVEYSGFRFAFFMLAEYVYLFAMGTLIALLYFGGWLPPHPALSFIPGVVWLAMKALFFTYLPFWFQATFPRVRIDQLMTFSWKVLMPLAILNIVLTSLIKYWGFAG